MLEKGSDFSEVYMISKLMNVNYGGIMFTECMLSCAMDFAQGEN